MRFKFKNPERNQRHMANLICLLTIGFWLGSASAQYQPGPNVDARQLDIATVKIGMSIDEAVAALVDRYKISKEDIKLISSPERINDVLVEIPLALSLTDEKREGLTIGHPSSGWELDVAFLTKFPYDKNDPVEVNRITYIMAWTHENQLSLRQASLEKYGVPTVDLQAMGFQWCDKPNLSWANCESEAKLSFRGTTLELIDTRPNRLRREAMDKANSKKPKI